MRPTVVFGWIVCAGSVALSGCGPSARDLIDEGIGEFQLGHLDQAEGKLKRGLKGAPADADALFYMGRLCHARKAYERAVYYYQCCLDEAPGYRGARKALAQAQKEAGVLGPKLRFGP